MDKKIKEKLLDSELPQKMTKRTSEFVEELFLKDTKCVANILGIQIGEDLGIAVTKTELIQFLTLMYGTLTCQERKIQEIKTSMLADIKKTE